MEAVIASQPLHRACQEYLIRLAAEGTTIVFNELLEIELQEAAFQLGLKERHPKDWKRYRSDGRARPRAARLATVHFQHGRTSSRLFPTRFSTSEMSQSSSPA